MIDLPARIPRIEAVAAEPLERLTAHVRLVDTETGMSWYVLACDPPGRCLGIVVRRHAVVGEFSLEELESLRSRETGRPVVEADADYRPEIVRDLARRDDSVRQLLPPSKGLVDLQ